MEMKMKLIAIAVLTACALWTDPAQSFDLHTHVAMTAKAVEKSALENVSRGIARLEALPSNKK